MPLKKFPRYAALLVLVWACFIFSLFYDRFTPTWTDPTNTASPFRLKTLQDCLLFQGQCLTQTPYALGARLFWGIVIPVAVVSLLLFGHRFWRQVCPLAWLSQIPRLLGLQSRKRHLVPHTGWFATHLPSIAFGVFFLGLNLRLLFANSDRLGLGMSLLVISLTALVVGFKFSGRAWCQYFCPMLGVEMIYMGTEGAVGNPLTHPKEGTKLPPVMCQTTSQKGTPRSACMDCSNPCMDWSPEQHYWEGILHPGKKWLYYGYIGLIIGFFSYFSLYSGNSQFVKSGAVWLETNQLTSLLQPGLYWMGQAIPIPKIVAVPLILGVSAGLAYGVGTWLERRYKQMRNIRHLPERLLQHRLFSVCTFTSFNLLFFMGVHPSLGWLPVPIVDGASWFLVVMITVWLCRALLRPLPPTLSPENSQQELTHSSS